MIDILYRSRQKENLDKDVLNFLSSLNEDVNILSYDILGTQAHCLMLNKIGILTSDELSRILSSLSKIKFASNDDKNFNAKKLIKICCERYFSFINKNKCIIFVHFSIKL